MLKDITFGQYFPSDSLIHKIDARVKFILILLILVVLLFFSGNFWLLGINTVFTFFVLLLSKIPLRMYFKNLKAVIPIIIFTAIINSFYVKSGKVLVDWWIFNITSDGLSRAAFMAIRVCLLILISATLTYTVTPNDLTDALERLLSPLKFVGLGSAVHVLTMMMTIALRFIPILIDETQKIMNAQLSRGADLESGGFISRIKALIPILIPLFVMSVRRSYDLAEAMECRCYNGGKGKQRMKVMKMSARDYACAAFTVLFLSTVVFLNYFMR